MSAVPQKSDPRVHYTYADYLEWDETERCEIIDGEIFMMATPERAHQEISRNLFLQIAEFLKGKPCQPYYAPFAVRLNPKEDSNDDVVLEPDILVVCDPSKLDKKGCNGPPDLVIEVISPSTARNDKVVKLNKYQNAGVREYWIVEPDTQTVLICVLDAVGRYIFSSYDETGRAPVSVLPGCEIDLGAVFQGLPEAAVSS
jgi:Uma2 family endonuclease